MRRIIPRGQIEWIVDRLHVGTSPEEVEAEILRRIPADWTPGEARAAVRTALRQHEDNRRLYRDVTTGMFDTRSRKTPCK